MPYFGVSWRVIIIPCHAVSRFWELGHPEVCNRTKIPKMKILKIKIHVAQNVSNVLISQKKNLLAPLGAIPGHFLHGPKNVKDV